MNLFMAFLMSPRQDRYCHGTRQVHCSRKEHFFSTIIPKQPSPDQLIEDPLYSRRPNRSVIQQQVYSQTTYYKPGQNSHPVSRAATELYMPTVAVYTYENR